VVHEKDRLDDEPDAQVDADEVQHQVAMRFDPVIGLIQVSHGSSFRGWFD
jgi:hypothetical protein